MKRDIGVVALLVLFASVSIGVPIAPEYSEKWRYPCGISTGPAPPGLPPMTAARRTETIGAILTNIEEALIRTRNLRNGYAAERVAGLVSTAFCSTGLDLDSIFRHVPGFPVINLDHGNILDLCSELSQSLLTDYEKMTRVMIFLEQTIGEEAYYSGGQYTPDLESLYNSIKHVMCYFNSLEGQCIPSQSSRNSTDLVSNYEQATEAGRYERDYIFIKDTNILLKGFSIKYNTCYELYRNTY